MKRRMKVFASLLAVTALVLTGCGGSAGTEGSAEDKKVSLEEAREAAAKVAEKEKGELKTDFSVSYDGIKEGTVQAGVSVHDPSVLEADGTYYIYGSHMSAAKSTDLRTWTSVAEGRSSGNPVYGKIYDSEDGALAYTGGYESVIPAETTSIWAPDVKYSEKRGLYYMYFCTSSNFYTSTVCYATSKTLEGPFEWQGNLVYSGFNEQTIDKTDVLEYVDKDYAVKTYMEVDGLSYNQKKYPNAIDPTIFWDKDGRMWMVYGSWSGGIFLLEIDEETGKVIHPKADEANNIDPYFGKRLIGGGHTSIEGPYIIYDSATDYYYMYVSYGALQRTGGYQIRVFRSKTPDGDYVDMGGQAPQIGSGNPAYFGLKLSGNYRLPSLDQAYMATGHNSAFVASDGKRYIVNHARFENRGEIHEPRVHQFLYNAEGWPCMLPYATGGETVSESGYGKEKIVGEYYMINQGTEVNSNIAEPVKVVLTEGGNVFGEDASGTWVAEEGSYRVHFTYNEVEYSGVFCEMNDEAGTNVMTFSAVGSNESIWGVKY